MPSPDSLRVTQLAPGLWSWTCGPSPCLRGAVTSFYCEAEAAIVLVDPVLPPEGSAEHARFFKALDGDVARLALPVVVVTTSDAHGRDAQALRARYPSESPGQMPGSARELAVAATERAVWLPSHGALVVGHLGAELAREALERGQPGAVVVRPLRSHET